MLRTFGTMLARAAMLLVFWANVIRAQAQDFAYIFTRNYVSIVDTRSSATADTILTLSPLFGPMGEVVFSPDGSVAYLLDGVRPNIRILDVPTGRLGTALTVSGVLARLERAVVSPDGRILYATSNDSLLVIDPTTARVQASICVGPHAADLALTPDGRKAYVTTEANNAKVAGFVVSVDLGASRVEAEIPMPPISENLAISPDGRSVYVPNPVNGTVSVIDTTRDEVTEVLNVAPFPRDVVFAPDGSLAYVTLSGDDSFVAVLDTGTMKEVDRVSIPLPGVRLSITSDGALLYVTHGQESCSVSAVGTEARSFERSVDVAGALGVAFTSVVREPPTAISMDESLKATGASPGVCAYVSHPFDDLVSVIDVLSGQIVGEIPVRNATRIVGDPDHSRLYVLGKTNQGTTGSLAVVDTAVNMTVDNILLLRGTAADVDLSAAGDVAVAAASTSSCAQFSRVDMATRDVTYSLPPEPDEPGALHVSIRPDGQLAYATSRFAGDPRFKIFVVDVPTLSVAEEIPFPDYNPEAVVFAPDNRFAYVSVQRLLDDPPNATGDELGRVAVIDTSSSTIVTEIAVENSPRSLAISPDGVWVYVANETSDSISVIDTSSNEVQTTIRIGESPTSIALSPGGEFLYVNSIVSRAVLAVDLASESVTRTIPLPFSPEDIAVQNAPGGCVAPPPPPSPTPAPIPFPLGACMGDCDGNLSVTVDELLLATGMALGTTTTGSCDLADWNRDGGVSIDELIEAVKSAIEGCSYFFCPF